MAGKEWSDADFGGLPSVLVAAHELKTPLALIRQMALLLDDDLTSAADKKQIQQRIVQTSEQALQLTVDLANSANLTPSLFPLEPVNPLALCQQIAAETRLSAALYGRKISWPRGGRNNRLILANRTLLGRILANFLNNALKYTEDDSEIKVSVTSTKEAVRLSVRDFGPMISLKGVPVWMPGDAFGDLGDSGGAVGDNLHEAVAGATLRIGCRSSWHS